MGLSRRSLLYGLGGAAGGVGVLSGSGFGAGRPSADAKALVAGSLLELANGLPGASVEAHGSVAVRRLIRDGLRDPDAVALADPRLFSGIADRMTVFATNAIVLAYDRDSAFAGRIRHDWQAAVTADGVSLGRTDPRKDPLGYRTVMALRLAERLYGLRAEPVLADSKVFLETDLMNVLEGGTLDAAFVYRNMAVQRDLPFVELPDEIDFSDPGAETLYGSVSFDLGDAVVPGAPIRYAAAALTDAGADWTETLVTAHDRLRASGFIVPTAYPKRDLQPSPGA